MKQQASAAALAAVVFLSLAVPAEAQTLRGSSRTMQKQNRVAQQHDYSFLETSSQVRRFVGSGYLVEMRGNASYELAGVSHPYARPAVKVFVERLAAQYRSACGEKLVVTSLTRPVLEQPRNASELSVHPAGMAVDLRVSRKSSCVRWIEKTLMSLEKQGVLDATKEKRPPHYHVALFPEPYTRYIASLGATSAARVASAAPKPVRAAEPVLVTAEAAPAASGPSDALLVTANVGVEESAEMRSYRVNRGDSLWSIARRHGTTVDALKDLNGLRDSQIVAGQTLTVPVVAAGAEDS
jgi:LysM repeat protein